MKACEKQLTIREIQEEEKKMLKKVIEFCEKYNITYYACGGTLLGAIRHKGFIPWDDDIDIAMPRRDMEKFEELVKNNNFMIDKNLMVTSFNMGNSIYPYCKVLNTDIEVETEIEKEYEKYLWIDILPIDGLPDNQHDINKLYIKMAILKGIIVGSILRKSAIKRQRENIFKKIIKLIINNIFKIIKIENVVKRMEKISRKYNYESSKYVGVIGWGRGGPKEKMLRSDVKNKKLKFEGMDVNGYYCYDEYLTNLYGDYMQLPPIEKRETHGIKAIKIIK